MESLVTVQIDTSFHYNLILLKHMHLKRFQQSVPTIYLLHHDLFLTPGYQILLKYSQIWISNCSYCCSYFLCSSNLQPNIFLLVKLSYINHNQVSLNTTEQVIDIQQASLCPLGPFGPRGHKKPALRTYEFLRVHQTLNPVGRVGIVFHYSRPVFQLVM